jgi:hypothetical protein
MAAMEGLIPVLVVAVIILVVVGLVFGHLQEKKRRQALAAWASAHGMSFDPSKDYSFDERFPEFGCLRQGENRYAYNIMAGEWDSRRFLGFDYHYETHSTDSKGRRQTHHHHFSAVILRAKIPLKPLVIKPENIFHKIGAFFGFDDIDFESAEFSRKFCVKSPDRKWAYDVIHTRTMEFLLAQPRHNIEFDREYVIATRGRKFKLEEYEAAVHLIDGVLDGIPEYVRKQQTQRV